MRARSAGGSATLLLAGPRGVREEALGGLDDSGGQLFVVVRVNLYLGRFGRLHASGDTCTDDGRAEVLTDETVAP